MKGGGGGGGVYGVRNVAGNEPSERPADLTVAAWRWSEGAGGGRDRDGCWM